MKQHTRKLLILLPFLPLLMANSPAPQREMYTDLKATYLSVESLHGYYFYHFNVKNVGDGYAYRLNIESRTGEKSFYCSIESNEIVPPFENVIIEPGFDKELIMVTKTEIPESKEVIASSYDYYVAAEDITFEGSKEVSYSFSNSYPSNNVYVYEIDAYYDDTLSQDYDYDIAIKLTYDGETFVTRSDNVEKCVFTTSETLDLTKLTVNEITMLRSSSKYGYRDYYYGIGCKDFLNTFLLFILIFFIFLGFGIFALIFFPAMARRRRRKALLEQDKK